MALFLLFFLSPLFLVTPLAAAEGALKESPGALAGETGTGELLQEEPTKANTQEEEAKSREAFGDAPFDGPLAEMERLELSPASPEVIAEYEEAVGVFQREGRAYREDIQGFVARRIEQEQRRVARRFDKNLALNEEEEREQRKAAIVRFETFLSRHRDDPRYTPDAMLRLAELYYERAMDEQLLALEGRSEELGQDLDWEQEPGLADEEWAPFAPSIALYQEVIARFPSYRMLDTVHYLLGYCLEEQGQVDEAVKVYQALISAHPDSRYTAEAWLRTGEYWFEYIGQSPQGSSPLLEAARAYSKAAEFKDSPLYDKALYKLGWTWFRLDDFGRAVNTFVRLVDHYEALAKDSDAAFAPADAGDLWAEALQYTAISFAERSFGGVSRLGRYFRSIGGREWDFEVYRRLGDMYFDAAHYPESIEAYRVVLAKKPHHPDAVRIQERIALAYRQQGERGREYAERLRLVSLYGKDEAWARANQDQPEALELAAQLVERSLLAASQAHVREARDWEKQVEEAGGSRRGALARRQALRSWAAAAQMLERYLEQYPHSTRLYELSYALAEALFASEQYQKAAAAYIAIRDTQSQSEWHAAAAWQVVAALEQEIERQEAMGRLPKLEPCTFQSCRGRELVPQEIPQLRLDLIAAADTYLRSVPESEDGAVLAYRAGQIFFAHAHFDEAFVRYEALIKSHPQAEVSLFAFEDMLNRHLLAGEWLKAESLVERILEENERVTQDPALVDQKRQVKFFARFSRASEYREREEWDEAAQLFLDLVDEVEADVERWGPWKDSDKALYNAAASFVAGRRFDSAMRTYERLFNTYPESELAEGALFEVAFNAEKAFDFDKAIDGYMRLVNDYPSAKQRSAALYNAARIYEALKEPEKAAQAYRRYSELFGEEPDAAQQAYQAALVYERAKNHKAMIDGLNHYLRRFDKLPSERERVVVARLKLAQAYQAQGNARSAQRAFAETLSEYEQRGLEPKNSSASRAAAEARFWQAEEELERFEKIRFAPTGRGQALTRNMTRQLETLANAMEALKGSYSEVIVKYRDPEWMMAALFRLGYVEEQFANRLLESPCPPDILALGGEEACFEYRIQLEEMMMPVLDRAALAYETAADRASELHIANAWTRLTMEKVCQLVPAKCRSLKEPRSRLLLDTWAPLPLLSGVDGGFEPRPNLEVDGWGDSEQVEGGELLEQGAGERGEGGDREDGREGVLKKDLEKDLERGFEKGFEEELESDDEEEGQGEALDPWQQREAWELGASLGLGIGILESSEIGRAKETGKIGRLGKKAVLPSVASPTHLASLGRGA